MELISMDFILANKVQPKKNPGIYFLINNDEIVYVGQCVNGLSRINHHKSDKVFDSFYFAACSEADLNVMEAAYIIKFNPVYNTCLPKNSRYMRVNEIKKTFGMSKRDLPKITPVYRGIYYDITQFTA